MAACMTANGRYGMPWDAVTAGSPWALLGLAVLAVIRGYLVPRSTVKLLMQRGDDAMAAWRLSEEARAVQSQQVDKLLEYARTADAVLRSLPQPRQP